MYLERLILFVAIGFLALGSGLVFAQERGTVEGVVTGQGESPLPGVSVVYTQNVGTATDRQGRYRLRIPAGEQELTFRFVGYRTATRTVEVPAGGTTTLDVQLQPDVLGLDEMVVSATRNPIESKESTISVSALSAKELESEQPTTLSDAVRTVPGVMSVGGRGRTNNRVWIRGFPELEDRPQYMTTLLDGLPLFVTNATPLDAAYKYDLGIERIEVVRGSAATLFGRAAAAGAVNIISKTGGNDMSGQVRFSGGQYGLYRGDVNVGGPLGENWRFNVTGLALVDDGVRKVAFDDEVLQLRGNVTRFLGDRGYLRVSGMYLSAKAQGTVGVPMETQTQDFLDGYDNRFSWAAMSDFERVSYPRAVDAQGSTVIQTIENVDRGDGPLGGHAGAELNYDLTDRISVDNKFRWNRIRYDNGTLFSVGFSESSALVPNLPWQQVFTGEPIHEVPGHGKQVALLLRAYGPTTVNEFMNDLQFSTEVGRHELSVGAYLGVHRADLDILGDLFMADLSPDEPRLVSPVIPNQGPLFPDGALVKQTIFRVAKENVTNWAVFGGDNFQIGDKLRVDVGVRWDQSHLDLSERPQQVFNPPDSLNNPADGTSYAGDNPVERAITIGDWSASLGINYSISEASAVYANVSRAFRTPNEDVFTPVRKNPSGVFVQPEVENPERIYSGELGAKTTFAGGHLGIDGAAFYTRINDRLAQSFISSGDGISYITSSSGSIRIVGAELGLQAAPSAVQGLDMRLTATYQDSEYVDFDEFILGTNPDNSPIIRDATGNDLPRVAPLMLGSSVTYDEGTFGGGLTGKFRSERPGDELNVTDLPAVFLLQAHAFARLSLGGGRGNLRFSLDGSNLLDVNEPQWYLDFPNIALALERGNEISSGLPYTPRRFTASITYEF
jgi:outer membrane receptor protein involved in Fe transport